MKSNSVLRLESAGSVALLILLAALTSVAAVPAGALGMKEYRESIEALTIGELDPGKLDPGSYHGLYETKFVTAEVEVTIASGGMSDIRLLRHENGKGGPGEAVIDRVLQAQSLQVDTVSGATASSKVILKAVEDALMKGSERRDDNG